MPDDEYIGVLLAVCSSIAIGSSYVTTKIGLKDAGERHGFRGDGFEYFKNPIWWTGMVMLVAGELFNFAAYAFAPAILVTPLGALSVLTGTVLGAYFLKERLGFLGKMGCALCLLGSVLIVANAPPERPIETVDEILAFAVKPGVLSYCSPCWSRCSLTYRFLVLLLCNGGVLVLHDILRLSQIWLFKPDLLPVHLCGDWSCLCHGIEGIWNCCEVNFRGCQPVCTILYLHICSCRGCLHRHTDELLQQSPQHIPSVHVSQIRHAYYYF